MNGKSTTVSLGSVFADASASVFVAGLSSEVVGTLRWAEIAGGFCEWCWVEVGKAVAVSVSGDARVSSISGGRVVEGVVWVFASTVVGAEDCVPASVDCAVGFVLGLGFAFGFGFCLGFETPS